jgi:hypothetical protein
VSPKEPKKNFLAKARSWATKRKLFGSQAFLKYVILNFLECLNEEKDEFIFKGGNLLWVYIQTPRQTVDLDLATINLASADAVRVQLEAACKRGHLRGIEFSLQSFTPIEDEGVKAASVRIGYKTDQGTKNAFEIDIVFVLPTDTIQLDSPLSSEKQITAASIENIIVDKVAASAKFGGGNTRMKDFDDLWRIAQSEIRVKPTLLRKLFKERKVTPALRTEWLNETFTSDWKRHQSRYKDLPKDIEDLFSQVNDWLKQGTS